MKIKEKWQNMKSINKTWAYWAFVIFIVDIAVSTQAVFQYSTTGQCRNYMVLHSQLSACSWGEFLKYGYNWLSFSNAFIFLPAIAIMVFASQIVDVLFAKPKD